MGVNAIKQARSDKKEFSYGSLVLDATIGAATGLIPGLSAGSVAKAATGHYIEFVAMEGSKIIFRDTTKSVGQGVILEAVLCG